MLQIYCVILLLLKRCGFILIVKYWKENDTQKTRNCFQKGGFKYNNHRSSHSLATAGCLLVSYIRNKIMTCTRKIVGKQKWKQDTNNKLHRKSWPGLVLAFPPSSFLWPHTLCWGSKSICSQGALASEPKTGGQEERKEAEAKLPAAILQVTLLLAATFTFVTLQGISAAKTTDNKNTNIWHQKGNLEPKENFVWH